MTAAVPIARLIDNLAESTRLPPRIDVWTRPLLFLLLALANAGCADGAAPARVPTPDVSVMSPAQLAALARPAVVSIQTSSSRGSGFVVHPEGWIMTDLHVIAPDMSRVWDVFDDERQLEVVEVLAASKAHDLAILRVDAKGLPTLPFGDSSRVRQGDSVVAMGDPRGHDTSPRLSPRGVQSGQRTKLRLASCCRRAPMTVGEPFG